MSDRTSRSTTAQFRVGEWLVEPARNRVSRDGESIALENKTMDTLVYLASRAGDVVSADDLVESVWAGRAMGDNPVYKSIANLRKAFGDDPKAPAYIETIPRRGYRLMTGVSSIETAGSASSRGRSLALVVAGAAIFLGVALAWLWPTQEEPGTADGVDSIAVLPFENLTGDSDNELIGHGIAEEILNHLAEIDGLRVMARRSAFLFQDADLAPAEFARKLDVRYLLTGSVRESDGLFRVSVRLLEADGSLAWSDSYDRQADEVLSLQNDVAQAIVEGLSLQVGDSFAARPIPSESFEAYTAYALGREYLRRRPDGWPLLAGEAFARAVRLDPEFAAAYAHLAIAQIQSDRGLTSDLMGSRALIDRALELDPHLAEAHAAAGLYELNVKPHPDHERAIRHLRRALELNSSLIDARNWLSISLLMNGQVDEAKAVLLDAIAIDPLNPVLLLNLSARYHRDGQLELARHQILKVFDLPDAPGWAWDWMAGIEKSAGRYDLALDWFRQGFERDVFGSSTTKWEAALIAIVYAELGLFNEANRWFAVQDMHDRNPWLLSHYFNVTMPQNDFAAFQQQVDRFASHKDGEQSWAIWPRLIVGSYRVRAGNHERAIEILEPVFAEGIPDYNGPGGADGIYAPAQHLAFAYQQTGRSDLASQLLHETLELQIAGRQERQDLLGAYLASEAVTYSLLGDDGMARIRLRESADAGWRAYVDAAANPCFKRLLDDPDLASVFEIVRNDLAAQRERVLAADEVNPINWP
jgi:TolB-like protein/DNA-binding winged helix-turn-helix (wHTH) protein/Flp pilus assembly protein TadD